MGLDILLFLMLVIMGALGYGGAYLYMHKQIVQREVEIQILHMYIEKEIHNERKRTLRV
jgi:hypothetical protein